MCDEKVKGLMVVTCTYIGQAIQARASGEVDLAVVCFDKRIFTEVRPPITYIYYHGESRRELAKNCLERQGFIIEDIHYYGCFCLNEIGEHVLKVLLAELDSQNIDYEHYELGEEHRVDFEE